MLEKVRIIVKDMSFYARFWGIWNALRIVLYPRLYAVFKGERNYAHNKIIMSLLRKEFAPIVEKYEKMKHSALKAINTNTPIWVCWWQGEEQMPEMIHKCYQLLCKNRNGHPVHLITQDNYRQYIELPEFILKKLQNKEITLTFLSDYLRMSLIAKHGGVWIDSTYWVTQPLDLNGVRLFTMRQDRFKGQGDICDFRWTCHCIGTGEPYYIFSFIRDCFIRHLTLHKTIVEYLLVDFVINLAYEKFEDFRSSIDNLPDHAPHIYIMPWLFNQRLDIDNLKEILETTPLLKMSYKQEYKRTTENGEPTYYDYFINQHV